MKNARVILKNPERVTHVNATKSVVYWKTSALSVATPMTRSPVSVLALSVNNLSAWTAKIVKNVQAHGDNTTGKMKMNTMLSIKKATQVTQANAAKLVQYWKTSAQVIATPAKKSPVSTPVFIADNPTA